MKKNETLIDQSSVWRQLDAHADWLQTTHLRDLFAIDVNRFDTFSLSAEGILFDFSKQLITSDTLRLLLRLTQELNLKQSLDRIFLGQGAEEGDCVFTNFRNKQPAASSNTVQAQARINDTAFADMRRLTGQILDGDWKGYKNHEIGDIVVLGIGGAMSGLCMLNTAFADLVDMPVRLHFVQQNDGVTLPQTLKKLNPATTLFIVVSKTFSSADTLANAREALRWMREAMNSTGENLDRHFMALTNNIKAAQNFGIASHAIIDIGAHTCDRFSLTSALALPIALQLGWDNFEQLRLGAQAMDRHVKEAPLSRNMPIIAMLLNVWNTHFLGLSIRHIATYDSRLDQSSGYIQQLEMESLGQACYENDIDVIKAPFVVGGPGQVDQHHYFQTLQQGMECAASEFITVAKPRDPSLDNVHQRVLGNCLAHSHVLAFGTVENVPQDAWCPGNRPSSTIMFDSLTPRTLGAFLAFCEHRTYLQASLLGLDPFHASGVEHANRMASSFAAALAVRRPKHTIDASTAGLIRHHNRITSNK